MNKSKCAILRLGSLKHKTLSYCDKYKWNINQALALGIILSNNAKIITEINFKDKMLEFEACLERWKKWNLSLIGKITVLKTFAIPKLLFPLTVLESPPDTL